LIDTSVVGVNPTSTIAELAALGPGIAFIDSSSYLFQFMGMATTNLYANALSEGNRKKSEQVLSRSVITAFFFGLALMAAQFGLAERAIKALSGTAVESIPVRKDPRVRGACGSAHHRSPGSLFGSQGCSHSSEGDSNRRSS
jgi:Na+-driven multidrug efflux pump